MKKYIMALDQGTTSSRCIIFDKKGKQVSMSQREFPQIFPKPGWVEHDPVSIWSTQLSVAIEALAKTDGGSNEIDAIGITNQRETTVVWERKTGKPIYNAIVWQCRRTAKMIDDIPGEMAAKIKRRCGLVPDAYFSASKIRWILDHVRGAQKAAEKGDLLFGTIDTWLMYNLSGKKIHATDHTNASRTMLFDIKKLKWDKEILGYFGIPESMMPEVYPSGHIFGTTDPSLIGAEIPICGVCGDQQSSLFGLRCFNEGDIKNTYGTGCFMLMNTGNNLIRSKNGLITTVAAALEKEKTQYALEGSIFIGGAVVQWLRDEMELIKDAALSERLAAAVPDTEGAYIVPAFTGLGAPHWEQDARGIMVGLTRGFCKDMLIRASLESIALQTVDVIRAMEADSKLKIHSLKADGGASRNDLLMQFQSDILNTGIERPDMVENTARGAAFIAGITSEYWKDKNALLKIPVKEKVFSPKMSGEKREEKLSGWKRAVETAVYWAKH